MAAKEFDWTTAHPWLQAANQFGRMNQSWHAVTAGTKEHEAWKAYFDRIGWTPVMFRSIGRDGRKWTAPCQWPEWLTDEKFGPLMPRSTGRSSANVVTIVDNRAS